MRERPALIGDEAELFAQLADELVAIIGRLVNTSGVIVEDACQFAWMQLLQHQPRRDTVRSWLITVAKREAVRLDQVSRRVEPMSIGEQTPGEVPEPPARVDMLEQALDLNEALACVAELPPRKARIFTLQSLGYSYAEIAEITGDSWHTVDRQLGRARELLRLNVRRHEK